MLGASEPCLKTQRGWPNLLPRKFGGPTVEVLSIRHNEASLARMEKLIAKFASKRCPFRGHWESNLKRQLESLLRDVSRMFPTLRHLPSWDRRVRETGKGGLKNG